MFSLKINYKNCSSELCEIGKKYDTDKSSQRNNVTTTRHCHPYTLFYDGLFKSKKMEKLAIAELGILDGASLLMWKDYFPNSTLYGFDNNQTLIQNFKHFNQDNVVLSPVDVTDKNSIIHSFHQLDTLYDIIIEDTTHQFEDQIRVIENTYTYLKPGGIMIIENIFKSYKEEDYINRLKPILHHFQSYYFIELDHVHRESTGWNNDKLFILTKGYTSPHKLTIITPSYRTTNLFKVKDSINFDFVDEWLIVYDGSKIKTNPHLFKDHDKIKEFINSDEGISGNPQRNYALSQVSNPNTLLYYLDDDNMIHPALYQLLSIIDNNKIYSFNQLNRIKGNRIEVNYIDTAMVILPYALCHDKRWVLDKYNADGYYMKECYESNKNNHVYIDNDLCYYNKLSMNR